MSLHENIAAAINGHNVMAVALSKIATGRSCGARDVARAVLTELDLDAQNVLKVHAEFEVIYAAMAKRKDQGRRRGEFRCGR